MTIFYICRHGETENNKRQRLMGWVDTPLTEEGRQNASSSAAKLKGIDFDKIVSSDLGRAFRTAYIISRQLGYTAEIETYSGLREVNYGDLANQPYSVYPELSSDENTDYVPTNGEALSQTQKRVLDCINSLASKYGGKTVLIVAHDGTINAIKASYSQNAMGREDATHNAHDFVAKFEWDNGQVKSFSELVK